ncbi:hypothetical protein EP47_09135 [Legionella norrlandica]|uniref:Flagellar biosynthetic protein FliR n=2 Tax=Legionella norrlandica TaxID=1498499 RepID=A0A0A2SRB1_9GAMM|nr:hypothetical protein EP47_09135 [Legionella norrlandica]
MSKLPASIRLALIFAFSTLIIYYLPPNNHEDNTHVLLGGIAEFFNGLILVTALYAAFSVFQIAGQLIDNETGLNSLAIFNPGEQTQESITSHFLSMLAVLFFFGLDGHLWLFKGLTYSFVIIPPGTMALFGGVTTTLLKQFAFMFSLTLMIASPIILSLLAIDLCCALIARTMPQVNTYFLILPIKILLGLFLLIMTLHYLNPLADKIFTRCFGTWQEIIS